MSVNDPLPWIPAILALIRQAVGCDIPIIGHCLGGQLLAKALGGEVTRNPVAEIGWQPVSINQDAPQLGEWLDAPADFPAFHWHRETFSLPPGSTRLMSSPHCANQAFCVGPHLGMQCHVEMTPLLIQSWNQEWAKEACPSPEEPAIQKSLEQLAEIPGKLPVMRDMARQLYEHWIRNLEIGSHEKAIRQLQRK